MKRFSGPSGFGMELPYALLEPFINDGHLTLQCCASLGEKRYGLFPWWHDPGTPDFHQPARFCPVRLA
jgi:UDP-N-acetylmuramate dehydrogenase